MKKIDLQIQTTCSDGRDSVERVLQMAHKAGISLISITDHDTVEHVPLAIEQAKGTGVWVVPGIEITVRHEAQILHILGYAFDAHSRSLLDLLKQSNAHYEAHYVEQLEQVVNRKLREAGRPEADAAHYRGKPSRYYKIPGLALFLFEEGIVEHQREGFQYLKGFSPDTLPITAADAIRALHEAGGLAVISHPFAPKLSLKKVAKTAPEQDIFLESLVKQGLDGIECYQTGHSALDTEHALTLAKKHHLLVTGGSDWHGTLEQTGENLKEYLPYYTGIFDGVEVPDGVYEKLLQAFAL